ncbi:cell division protein FtsA [Propylenella binzhouense]|uniref:Cell division protein FtsA n=1 Tax=Propylenella binzhouense TaxID=2555902 RepID=A0A964T1W9_9HYPH|nr:cell division protein FtsA [Propylenella binzhouense]MYZ46946.1 cell division protein FtsA [Propylenella binzhouense]
MRGAPDRTVAGVSRIKPLSARRSAIVSVLDVGSTKITCLIARLRPSESEALRHRSHAIEVLGFGTTRSRGVKSGFVVDLDEAEVAMRLAVDQAERMAEMTVGSVIVNLSCGRLRSEVFSAGVAVRGPTVTNGDVQRVLAAGGAHSVREGRMVVHSVPIGYALEGQHGIADPCGMVGEALGIDMHVVTADESPLRNLELAINRCHLEVETVVATPYASGLSTLVEDEAELGVACIDLGGGTTTLSVFCSGQFVHADAVPIGGNHITLDIARGLSTGLADAERLKAKFGSALPSASDDKDILTIPPVGEDERDHPNTVPRSALTRIVRPRVEETLEMARDMLLQSGFAEQVGRRVVLTGGASQLTGVAETARRILGRNVRLGRPLGIAGMPDSAKGPAFSAAVGLVIYPQVAKIEQFEARQPGWGAMTGTDGYLARMGRWLWDSF